MNPHAHAPYRAWLERLHGLGALFESQARGELGRTGLERLLNAGLVERLVVGEGEPLVRLTRRGRRELGARWAPCSTMALERRAAISLEVRRLEGEGWRLLKRGPWAALLEREGERRLIVWSRDGRPSRARKAQARERGAVLVVVP